MSVQRPLRNIAATAALAVLALVAAPSPLLAHARLVRSAPSSNALLDRPPSNIELWFSEAPALKMTSLEVLDSTGARVALGPVSAEGIHIAAAIARVLAPGRYTVVWRTAADDGHVSDGRFFFTVGPVPSPLQAAGAPPRAEQPNVPNSVVETAPVATMSNATRWAEYMALFIVLGATVFRLVVVARAGWPQGALAEADDRARRFAQYALVLFLVTTLMRLSAEADLVPVDAGRLSRMMLVIRDTHWGLGWAIGGIGVVVTAVGFSIARRRITGWAVASIGAIAMAIGETLTSHAASATRYQPLAVATDFVHLASAGTWLGGLAIVLFAGLPSLASTGEPDAAGSRLVGAFHKSAVESVTLVVLSAIVSAWLRVGSFNDFVATPYGRVLFRKTVVAVVVLAVGAYHWRRFVIPAWGPSMAARFRRSVILELLLVALVLAATAVLTSTALPDDAHQTAHRAPAAIFNQP